MLMTDRDQPAVKADVLEWIHHILDRKNWTGTDLARKSGLAPSTILRLLNDPNHKFVPSMKTLKKIADGSGYPIPRTLVDAVQAAQLGDEPPVADVARPSRQATAPAQAATVRRQTVKVRHVSSLPASLQPKVREDVYVPAPYTLEGDETAFAFYMPDAGLEPWTKAGSLMFATRRRDPKPHDMVLVIRKDGRSTVKLCMDINENGVVVSQSHPPKPDLTIPFDDIDDIAVVAVINLI